MRIMVSMIVLLAAVAVSLSPFWVMVRHAAGSGENQISDESPFVVVLGMAQDGGCPHAGCDKPCCREAWTDSAKRRLVSCLAVIDPQTHQRWVIDATPDFPSQLHALDSIAPPKTAAQSPALDGIFLTHGHIGHYTGLMHLGREVMNARDVPVHAMPRMRDFLSRNGPWDQLVRLNNISIRPLEADVPVQLNERLSITPILAPHRDEYTETVGFIIKGPNRSVLFIPDIDKWEKWDRRLEDVLANVDVAFLDGTFYDNNEIPGRSMAEIPHPFIKETMQRLAPLPADQRGKVRFIHLNHTNPALQRESPQRAAIEQAGFHVADERERHPF